MKPLQRSFRKLTKSLAVALIVATCLCSADAGLIARWTFDEVAGNTVLDSVGGYNGVLSPTGARIVSNGRVGNAVSLTKAANGYVNMGNVLGLTSGNFSLVVWIRMNPGDTTDASIVLGKHDAGSRNGYFLNVNKSAGLFYDGRVLFHEGGIGFASMTEAETPLSTTIVNDGNWHQIVAVYETGGTKKIYIDGAPAEDAKPSQPFIANAAAFLIGGQNEGGIPKGKFTGLIDEVQVYSHALNDSEIGALFVNPSSISIKRRDIVVRGPSGALQVWYMNRTNYVGEVVLNGGKVAATGWQAVGVIDFNGDADLDILWQHTNGGVAVWKMNGLGVAQAVSLGSGPRGWKAFGYTDLNNDGRKEVVWKNGPYLATSTVNGSVMQQPTYLWSGYTPQAEAVAMADFDRDGRIDFLWQNSSGFLFISDHTGYFPQGAPMLNQQTVFGWRVAGASDYNGDGWPDILWQHYTGRVAVWLVKFNTRVGVVQIPVNDLDPNERVIGTY